VKAKAPVGLTTDCNCSALRQAARVVTRAYDAVLAELDLGASQYAILVKLDRSGPLDLCELAARLVMDRSTVGHLLRPLEKRGLLTIGTSAGDGRKRVIALSAAGRELAAKARPLWAGAQARFEERFGAAEAEAMRSTLARVVEAERQRSVPVAGRSEP
jgi:DNA-binding MarR family transcriptional regulator